jgi:nitroreductase
MKGSSLMAQDTTLLSLPKPDTTGGTMPIMEALKHRRSVRAYKSDPIPQQILANLLWAAWGENRPDKRTAPSAVNNQEMDVYVSMATGLFKYDARHHGLKKIHSQDIRKLTGEQPFAATAPLNLIYVADLSKMDNLGERPNREFHAAADAGFISQNVYLYCASAGLATIVRGWLKPEPLAKAMGLSEQQKILFAQTVGYEAVEKNPKK